MKNSRIKLFLVLITLISISLALSAQKPILLKNEAYQITIPIHFSKKAEITIQRSKLKTVSRSIDPELTVLFSLENPQLVMGAISEGNSPVAGWKKEKNEVETDFWAIGDKTILRANKVISSSDHKAVLRFENSKQFTLSLTIELQPGDSPPVISWTIIPKVTGWFSVGFTGIKDQDPSNLYFLYQPMVWTWKRFPAKPVLTTESFATTAATFTNTGGATEGIAPDVSEIPYRFATLDNSRFGLSLRTSAGMAKPVVFAPIAGGAESKMEPGNSYTFKCRYFLEPGDWYAGMQYLYSNVIGYKTERQNATVTLNQTFENMVEYAMSDVYSGWMEELKGSDYKFDVPGTVKNVSALHPLSVALTTGNPEIYRRRALPMIEYLMSREKYLYAVNDQIMAQNPSHFMKGPAMEIGELASLYQMTGERNSAFTKEMDRIFGKSRQLNLAVATGGASWSDYLAKYRIQKDTNDLKMTRKLADEYLKNEVNNYPKDFNTNSGLKDRQATFFTDFAPKWYDLLELYEETHEQKYLDAAAVGARQSLLWLRSNPLARDSIITVNKGGRVKGVFPGRRHKADSYEWKEYDTSTEIPEQNVQAWRTSLVGLPPEQPHTYQYGPIMLAHHAAWMLRLGELTNDPLLKDAAYNAVIGRYANFPGYYFTSLETTVYQQADYPLHPYLDVKYNAIFFNHIWAHIALVQDFLVSDVFFKSGGRINFPSAYSPGYAFLSSKVYGHLSGKIFDNNDVHLWLPPKAIQSSEIALNHLFGVTTDDTWLVLTNTSPNTVNTNLYFNPDVIRWNKGQTYSLVNYQADETVSYSKMTDGKMDVTVPGNGLVAVKIVGLKSDVQLQRQIVDKRPNPESRSYVRQSHDNESLGTITGMLLNLVPQFSDAYIYTDATEKQTQKVTLIYNLGNKALEKIVDTIYPYEFSIHMPDSAQSLKFKIESEGFNGINHESKEFELKN
jgi:hypothetical protein